MPRYTYEQIYEDLKGRIGPGKQYPPGAALPSRAQLREQYGVSGAVIDRAMWLLRNDGLTEALPGVAVFVVEEHPSFSAGG